MYCQNCGKKIETTIGLCTYCGAVMGKPANPSMNSLHSTNPQELGMKWYHFLIYFLTYFIAALYVIDTLRNLASLYLIGSMAEHFINGLSISYIVESIYFIAMAVCWFFIGLRLTKFRKNAPRILITCSVIDLVVTTVFNFIYAYSKSEVLYTPMILRAVLIGVFIGLNYTYFKKRKHLFVN